MKSLWLSVAVAFAFTCASNTRAENTTRIAFGACAHEDRPQPIWDAIVASDPDLFIFAGDNIYGDTTDMNVLKEKYAKLGAQPGYQRLLETCDVLAVYDDHDYGVNDGGKHYPKRKESAEICLDFFNVPTDDPRRTREGIYGSQIIGAPGQRVQIILLDTRYFRDDYEKNTLSKAEKQKRQVVGWYQPTEDTTKTLIGEAQWQWLEEELKKEADVRIIVSS
ncbi:MAG: alkaline phosphatase D family protein, partial [Verrucomicrobiota bacterium]